MSEQPLVSICCLTYNHESYIRQCLDGFIKQKVDFFFELLIHDDASTDGTADIIREYEQKHHFIKAIYQSENQYCRGEGFVGLKLLFDCAKGKYLAYCEGDNYWTDPLQIQKQVEFLETHPDYVITYHNAKRIDDIGNPIVRHALKTDDTLNPSSCADFSGDELKRGEQTIATPTVCFRNVFNCTSYPEEFYRVSNADVALFSFLGNFGCGKYMGDVIAPSRERIHPGGAWSVKNRIAQLKMLAKTYHQIMKFYRRTGDVEMAYYYREKEFNTLKALLGKGTKSGKRGDLVGPYGRYSQICIRHLCGAARLHAKVALRLILGVRL